MRPGTIYTTFHRWGSSPGVTELTMNYGRLIGKAEAIIATGMPGLYRVLAFIGVQKIYSLSDLGRAASAFSVAQILAFFTAIGWTTLILARVPAAHCREDGVQRFYELVQMAAISLVAFAVGIVLWAWAFPSEVSGLETGVIMAGWTFYQVTRHYFVALREYRRIIAYDLFLLAATAAYVVGCHDFGIAAGFPLGLALLTTGALILVNIGRPQKFLRATTFEFKGLEFGFNNFLSGGVALSLVPIANFTEGAHFAGVVSLVVSFSAICALIPRAISLYRLPELSKLVSAGKSLADLTSRTAREVALACGGAFLVNVGMVVGLALYQDAQARSWYALICGLVICAQNCISMLGMAQSNVLMVREASRASMAINLTSCGLFVATMAVFYAVSGGLNFSFVLAVCIVATLVRNSMLRRRSAPLLASSVRPC